MKKSGYNTYGTFFVSKCKKIMLKNLFHLSKAFDLVNSES